MILCLSSCHIPVVVAERWAILYVLVIKLTKETRRRVWRGRDKRWKDRRWRDWRGRVWIDFSLLEYGICVTFLYIFPEIKIPVLLVKKSLLPVQCQFLFAEFKYCNKSLLAVRCDFVYGLYRVPYHLSGFWIRIRIRINLSCWIRIQEGKNEPQK